MKRFSLLCCLALLVTMLCTAAFAEGGVSTPTDICTTHDWDTATGICKNCDEPCTHDWDATTGKCTTGKCNTCKMVCAHAQYQQKSDATNHWEACSVCSFVKAGTSASHKATCLNPKKCVDCGYESTTDLPGNSHDYGYYSDGDDCVYGCPVCQAEDRIEWTTSHVAACNGDDHTCQECGYVSAAALESIHAWGESISDGAQGHHSVCVNCGEVEEISGHLVVCDDPTRCCVCSYVGNFSESDVDHDWDWDNVISDGAAGHHIVCLLCDKEDITESHSAYCTNPNTCLYCGYEGTISDVWHTFSSTPVNKGEAGHEETCEDCGFTQLAGHWRPCTSAQCDCGYTGEDGVYHEEVWVSDGAAGCHVECTNCDYKDTSSSHYAYCDTPDECSYCGYKGTISKITHRTDRPVSAGAEGHVYTCSSCGETEQGTHNATCDNPTLCWDCGYVGPIEELSHYSPVINGMWEDHDETNHWYTCKKCNVLNKRNHFGGKCSEETSTCNGCGAAYVVAHTWGDPVTANGKKTYTCTVCGKTKEEVLPTATPAPTDKPTAKPATHTHTWGDPETVDATCTADGSNTYTCACGKTKVEALPALGHSWGAYITNGDGTHAHTCALCDETSIAACTMADTKIGTLDASACIYCGYITWNLTDVDANGKQQGQAITNAAFEMKDDKGQPVDAEKVTLVVYESAPEVTVQLDTGANVLVKKALTISLLEDSAPMTLKSAVKLSIPMAEDVTGLKLLVMDENGELVEIQYEIIDGVMVFETEILGIFLLVEEAA